MTLKAERQAIADAITADGLNAFAYIPGKVSVPSAVVSSGSPYLEAPDTFGAGRFRGHWRVMVIVSANSNENGTSQADDLTEDVLVSLINAGYGIEQVDPLGAVPLNGETYLGIPIYTTKQIQL